MPFKQKDIFNLVNDVESENQQQTRLDFAMFDNESELVGAVQYSLEQLDECLFICNSCHEHFPREEMDFDVDDDQDLCKTCNYQSYNDAPYGENNL